MTLLPHHLADLRSSGLNDATIEDLGYYSGDADDVERILGWRVGPGLVVPYPCYDGMAIFCRVKPDDAPILDGGPAKYLSPKGASVRAYIPPMTREALQDPQRPVIITEGEKKAAKADQEGFPCIGLAGVWCFRDKTHDLIPDLMSISWKDRPVQIVFDSDAATKPEVQDAAFRLELVLGGVRCHGKRWSGSPC